MPVTQGVDLPALRVITTNYGELIMTTCNNSIGFPYSASSKPFNILKNFKEKLKNYVARNVETTDPQKLELEAMKNTAYQEFGQHLYLFLSESPSFSIKHL